jgi:glycosyltransferase involved in cell wall biosynthesis
MLAYSFYDSDNRVIRYAETLAARGDSVDVIGLRYDGQARTEVIHGVNVCRIQGRKKNERSTWAYLRRMLAFCVRASLLITCRHLRRRYDLIHVHSMPDFLIFAAWWPRLTRCRLILDIHDLLPEFYRAKFKISEGSLTDWALLLEERLSADMADHIIVPNHLWEERVANRLRRSNECSVIINAPDRSIFQPRNRKRKDAKIVLLYPGSLNQHQGLDIAIRAVASARERVPGLEFHIYGSGPEQHFLEKLIAELGLEKVVFLRSARPIWEIAEIMPEADLGVVPKRSDSFGDEAFSTKILEFMASGVPVVVSNTKVDRHYFNDTVVKFFPSGDVDRLAEAIVELAQSSELRNHFVTNGFDFVRLCDWEKNKVEYLSLVDAITGRRPASQAPICHTTMS